MNILTLHAQLGPLKGLHAANWSDSEIDQLLKIQKSCSGSALISIKLFCTYPKCLPEVTVNPLWKKIFRYASYNFLIDQSRGQQNFQSNQDTTHTI